MNKKTRRQAEKTAKATVAKRHIEPTSDNPEGNPNQPDLGEPTVVKMTAKAVEGAMPKLPKLPKASRGPRKEKPMVDCACGCGGQTRSTWVPGHDARAKGWALRIDRNVCKMSDVPENEQAGAKLMLKALKEGPKADIKLVDKAVNQ